MARALALPETLWLDILDVEVIPQGKPDKRGRRRKPQRIRLESRALAILDKAQAVDFEGEAIFLAASVMPGKWAEEYWYRGLNWTGRLAQKALNYDPYRMAPEKGLAKDFAFHFSFDQTGQADTLPRHVNTLLEGASIPCGHRNPKRTRQRFDQVMDRLVKDGIIGGWGYRDGMLALPPQGWLQTWLVCRLDCPAC